MKPKVGQWYKYNYTHKKKTSCYIYDVFKVTGYDIRDYGRYKWVIFKESPIDSSIEWHLSKYFWNRYVKEIDKEELMVELI